MDLFPSRDDLIKELRAENKRLREDARHKHYCVVCDQNCKRYTRNLYSTPMRVLIALYKLHKAKPEELYFHIRSMFMTAGLRAGGCGYELLGKYHLAEVGEPGFWKITDEGKDFVKQLRRMPKYVLEYNNIVEGFLIHETVDIVEALGKKFNYHELMSR